MDIGVPIARKQAPVTLADSGSVEGSAPAGVEDDAIVEVKDDAPRTVRCGSG